MVLMAYLKAPTAILHQMTRKIVLASFVCICLWPVSTHANDTDRQIGIRREWNEFLNAWFPEPFQIDCPHISQLGYIFLFEKNILGNITVKSLSPSDRSSFRSSSPTFEIESYDITGATTAAVIIDTSLSDLNRDDQFEIARSFAQIVKPIPPKIDKPDQIFEFFSEIHRLGLAKLSFDFVTGTLKLTHDTPKSKLTMVGLPSAGSDASGKQFTSINEYDLNQRSKCFLPY